MLTEEDELYYEKMTLAKQVAKRDFKTNLYFCIYCKEHKQKNAFAVSDCVFVDVQSTLFADAVVAADSAEMGVWLLHKHAIDNIVPR